MKLLFSFLLIVPVISFSQSTYFTLTPSGFQNASDTTKNYIVLTYPGEKQNNLFNKTLLYLNKAYRSPKDVISKVENQSITISGYQPNAIHRNTLHVFSMGYSLTIEFKDERMKVSAPAIELTTYTTRQQAMYVVADGDLGSTFGIWNTRGKLRTALAKNELEAFFNTYIERLGKAIKSGNDW